jgi:hypothetical protein
MKTLFTVVLLIWISTGSAFAQERYFHLGMGVSGIENGDGWMPTLLFAGGVAAIANGWLLINVDAMGDLGDQVDADSRYQFDRSASRCRDMTTGQFARTDLCQQDTAFFFGIGLDANILTPFQGTYIGGGYRVGHASTPYVSLGWTGRPWILVRGIASPTYVSLSIRVNAGFQ